MIKDKRINICLCIMLLILFFGSLTGESQAAADDASIPVPPQVNNQTDQETRSYWTQERMQLAQPAPMPSLSAAPLKALPPPHAALLPVGSNEDQTKQ